MNYSIRAGLRIDKADKETGECPVSLYVILDSRFLKFRISAQSVHPDFWNKKAGLVDISKLSKNSAYKRLKADYEELNEFILDQISDFKNYMMEQRRLKFTVTPDKVRGYFKSGKSTGFYEFWDDRVELMKPRLKESTLSSYQNTKEILKLFRPTMTFGDINLDFIKRFDNYLTTERGNHAGGKYNRHKNLKAILKEALRAKLLEEDPYVGFKGEPVKGNRKFLTFEEVVKIKDLVLSEEHRGLESIKNMFLFSCLTGLRFSDVQNLRWKDVSFDEKKIEIKMVKTSNPLKLALIPDALEILNGLKGFRHPESFVFKRITNQAINRSIKTVMGEAGIKKQITFHCARHTFATVHLEIGTSIYQVKDMLGHQSVKDTQIYAKNLQKEMDGSMDKFGQILMAHVNPNLERKEATTCS